MPINIYKKIHTYTPTPTHTHTHTYVRTYSVIKSISTQTVISITQQLYGFTVTVLHHSLKVCYWLYLSLLMHTILYETVRSPGL